MSSKGNTYNSVSSGVNILKDRADSNGIEKMILTGLPVSQAWFHSAVNNGENVPENNFSEESGAPGRRVQMWCCPPLLVCFHKEKYFFTPLSNVAHGRFK